MRNGGLFESKNGKIFIDADVIAGYAGSVAMESFGIVGMAAINLKEGIVGLLKKDYLKHGIKIYIDENNVIDIDFHVIVSYGVSISSVTENLIESVKYKLKAFTGMTVRDVKVYVEGIRVID